MKKTIISILFACFALQGWAQYQLSETKGYPREAQRRGYGVHSTQLAQMDDGETLEEVILYSAHNGHYPYFDLFRNYYAIVDHYTKEVKFLSDIFISTDRVIQLDDRNNDGKMELYWRYIKDGQFTVDEHGNNLRAAWVNNCVEFVPGSKQAVSSNPTGEMANPTTTRMVNEMVKELREKSDWYSNLKTFRTADYKTNKKIKTLIVTGQDGSHWWQGGSEAMQITLENSGYFTVDVAITPTWNEDMTPFRPDFKKYDLVLVNYGGTTWAEQTRKDFEKFVADGGGVVVIHSSIVGMDDWEGYNEMIGLGAWNGRNEKDGPYVYWQNDRIVYDYSPGPAGHHALQRPSTIVHRQPEHPILKGLPPVWEHFKDEIYSKGRGPAKNLQVLATTFDPVELGGSGRHEPMLWTVNYGKGRVFVTLLGHAGNDPEFRYAMECTGFQVTLLRGAEWAATGDVTQPIPNDFPGEGVMTLRKDFRAPHNAF